jgi:hypothetical protein
MFDEYDTYAPAKKRPGQMDRKSETEQRVRYEAELMYNELNIGQGVYNDIFSDDDRIPVAPAAQQK